jgi:hypothetical protein
MKLLDRLQRRLGRFAVPHVTEGLIAGQVVFYALSVAEQGGVAGLQVLDKLAFVPSRVLAGELWRPFSFVFEPPLSNPVFAFFFWYLFYLMGTTLEHTWGTFRYNVFLLVGYVATVGAAFLVPEAPASILFLEGSVFLAFAYLYPDFRLYVMFVLPVRIKWLALLTWISYFLVILSGNLMAIVMMFASVANFFVFFGRDILRRARSGHRLMQDQASRVAARTKPRHRCAICGITNLTHPDMDFRYCSKCAGSPCYCEEHLHNHQHVERENQVAAD